MAFGFLKGHHLDVGGPRRELARLDGVVQVSNGVVRV